MTMRPNRGKRIPTEIVTKPLVSEQDAQVIVKPHRDTIKQCLLKAWERFEQLAQEAPDIYRAISASTRAAVVNDLICQNIEKELGLEQGITLSKKKRLFTANIQDRLLARFKKLNGKYRGSNIPTVQQVRYYMQLSLPDFPDEPTRVTIGYVLDALQKTIVDIRVTLQLPNSTPWSFSLLAAEPYTAPAPIVKQLSLSLENEPGETEVKPKKDTQRRKEKNVK